MSKYHGEAGFTGSSQPPAAEQAVHVLIASHRLQPPAAEHAAAFTWLKHMQKEMRTTYKDVAAIATDPHQSTKKNDVVSRVGAVLRARQALPAEIRIAVNSWKGKNMDKKQKALKKQPPVPFAHLLHHVGELTTDQKKMIASYRQLAIIASYTGNDAKAQQMLDAAKKIEIQTGEKLPLPLMGEKNRIRLRLLRMAGGPSSL
jgi:hypothetical protein